MIAPSVFSSHHNNLKVALVESMFCASSYHQSVAIVWLLENLDIFNKVHLQPNAIPSFVKSKGKNVVHHHHHVTGSFHIDWQFFTHQFWTYESEPNQRSTWHLFSVFGLLQALISWCLPSKFKGSAKLDQVHLHTTFYKFTDTQSHPSDINQHFMFIKLYLLI